MPFGDICAVKEIKGLSSGMSSRGLERFRRVVCVWALVHFALLGMGQNGYKSQNDLRKNAERAFEDRDYVKATPLFSQLLSTVPKDANFNFKYGVCILYTGRDKSKCLRYLQVAAKNPKTSNDVYYYLGKAYHLNQRYDEAIASFTTFKKNATSGDIQKKGVEAEIQSCNNAKNHLGGNVNQVIVSKSQIPFSSFTTAYDVSAMGGKILDKPANYKMKADKMENANSVIYLNANLKIIYFSSYGNDGKNGKDIYKIVKNKKGEWSEPINLGAIINTASDEDYPFISSDGKTLYFSSKGHNSIGGFDVFKSVFDSLKGIWSQPVNMGTPVNSAFDDLFFVVDTIGTAYFSTQRESTEGNIGFYKMVISEKPIEYTTIAGTLTTDRANDMKDAKISILNYNDGTLVQVVKSDSSTGGYSMKLKPGRGYTIVVEKNGYLPHAENIYVPEQLVEHELGQKLQLSNNDSSEKMTISNYFSILENNSDKDNAIQTEEIVSDFKRTENYTSKLKSITIEGQTVNVTPPVNDISMQAKTLTVSLFTPEKVNNNANLDTTNALVVKGNNSMTASKPDEVSKVNNEELTVDSSKQSGTKVISGTTTNDELVSIAYNDASTLQTEAKEMKKNGEIAENIGRQRDSLANIVENDAVQLTKKIETERNPLNKQKLRDSVYLKKEEAKQKREEAVVAFELAKDYSEEGTKLQSQADESYNKAKELEVSVGSKIIAKKNVSKINQGNKIKRDSTENKGSVNSSNDLTLKTTKRYSDQFTEKQKAIDSATMAANQLKQQSTYLANKATDTINKASITPEPEKTRLRKKAAEMERQSAQKQIEADQANTFTKKLKDSAEVDKRKVQIATGIANVILKGQPTSNLNSLSEETTKNDTIDKPKYERNITKDIANTTIANSKVKTDTVPSFNSTTQVIKDEKSVHKQDITTQDTSKSFKITANATSTKVNKIDTSKIKDNIVVNNVQSEATSTKPIKSNPSDSLTTKNPDKKVAELYFQSKQLNEQSQLLFAKAKNTKKQKEKIKLMKEAQNLSDSSIEKQKQADFASSQLEQIKGKEIIKDSVKTTTNISAYKPDSNIKKAEANVVRGESPTIKDTTNRNKFVATKSIKIAADSAVVSNINKGQHSIPANSVKPLNKSIDSVKITSNEKQPEGFIEKANRLDMESESLAKQSKELYAKAKLTDDKVERRNLNMQAYNLQTESTLRHQQSKEIIEEANRKEAKSKPEPEISYESLEGKKNLVVNHEDSIIKIQPTIVVANQDTLINAKQNQKGGLQTSEVAQKIDSLPNMELNVKPLISTSDEAIDKTNPDFPKYIQLVASTKEKQKATETEFAKAVELENEAKEDVKNAQDKIDEATKIKKKKQKQQLTKEAKGLQSEGKIKQHDADSIYAVAKELARQSDGLKAEAILLREKLVAAKVIENKKEQVANNASNNASIVTNSPTKNIFSVSKNKVAANDAKPIPHNEKLPDGLFFKVQIGAFKTPVSAAAFKGLQPVTYEDGPNGWLRYTAGLFQTFESANLAKKEIRNMGYRDAFVVAYRNGKRISIFDAGSVISTYTPPQKQTYQVVYVEESKVLKENNIYPEKYAPEPNDVNLYTFNNAVKISPAATVKTTTEVASNNAPTSTTTATAAVSTTTSNSNFNIKNTEGLFYAVQVGVYGTATPPRVLESLKPLNTEVTAKGYYRFLSGMYNYFPPADAAKTTIARTLVPDAFVVAYYKGARIGLVQARALEKTVTPMKFDSITTVAAKVEPLPVKPNVVVERKDNTTIESAKQPEVKAPEETLDAANIIFKVQLGAYREQIPFEVVDLFLKLSSKNITHTKDADGLTYYFAGAVKDYDAAVQLRSMVVAAGIKDAFVVAFSGEKKISIDQARKALK